VKSFPSSSAIAEPIIALTIARSSSCTGAATRYFDVPEVVYEGLCSAPSAGEFANAEIKPCYRFEIEARRRRFRPD